MTNITYRFFKKPFSSTILAMNLNPVISSFMICLQALIIGIFFTIIVSLQIQKSSIWLPAIFQVLGLSSMNNSIDIPYFEIFLKVFAIVIIQFFILAGLFYICGKLFGKREGSFQSVISVMAMASVISSYVLLAGIILFPVFPIIVCFMFALSFIATLLLNHAGIIEIFYIDENMGIYLTCSAYIIYFILISIFVFKSLDTYLLF